MGRTRVITSYLDEKTGTVERSLGRIDRFNQDGRLADALDELRYLDTVLAAMRQEVDKELRAIAEGA